MASKQYLSCFLPCFFSFLWFSWIQSGCHAEYVRCSKSYEKAHITIRSRGTRQKAAAPLSSASRQNHGMKKIKKKTKKTKRAPAPPTLPPLTWMDDEGMHLLASGKAPSADQLEERAKKFQEGIRKSPMWEETVRTFGKEKAGTSASVPSEVEVATKENMPQQPHAKRTDSSFASVGR